MGGPSHKKIRSLTTKSREMAVSGREHARIAFMSGLQTNRWLPVFVLGATDALCLAGAGIFATWLRFLPQFFSKELGVLVAHPVFLIYALGMQALLAASFDLYRPGSWKGRDHLFVRILAVAVTLPTALMLGVYLVPAWRFGRGLLLMTLLISLSLETALRYAWLAWGRRPPARRAVVVGDGCIISELQESLDHRPWPPFRIVQLISSEELNSASPEVESALEDADLLIVASLPDSRSYDRIASMNFRGRTVIDAAAAYAELTGRIPITQVDSEWFIASGDFSSIASSPFHQVQRGFDFSLAAILLAIGLPIFLLGSLVIFLSDGFPIIYRQERLGRFRIPFTLYKLRTMRRGAEDGGPCFAGENDERTLLLGAFLRRWRIDELPQLINVIKGDMSLVGPRPERPGISATLEEQIPFFAFRFSVRPGLTGWAQVNQPYCAEIKEHRIKLEYDLYFLRSHGMAMYALVLIKTLGALVFRAGR